MMGCLMAMLFLPVLYLWGRMALELLYGRKKQNEFAWEDGVLTGGLLLIGLAEAAHLGALVRGRSVSAALRYFLILFVVMTFASAVTFAIRLLARGKIEGTKGRTVLQNPLTKREIGLLLAVLAVAAFQVCGILLKTMVYLETDITLETVVTFLKEDLLYGSNPLTGMPYELGLPSRLKILCLPTLYAMLSRMTGASPESVIYHAVPTFVLVMAYLSYRSLARTLFSGQREDQWLFLLLAGILFWVGDAMYGLEGFGLLHAGFQGVTIRGSILLPYVFGLCLKRKWRLTLGVILAEACLVWTLYGAGVCLAVVVLFWFFSRCRECFFARKGGA